MEGNIVVTILAVLGALWVLKVILIALLGTGVGYPAPPPIRPSGVPRPGPYLGKDGERSGPRDTGGTETERSSGLGRPGPDLSKGPRDTGAYPN